MFSITKSRQITKRYVPHLHKQNYTGNLNTRRGNKQLYVYMLCSDFREPPNVKNSEGTGKPFQTVATMLCSNNNPRVKSLVFV